MTPRPDPFQPPDTAARTQARALLAQARHAALAFTDPVSGTPGISRIALGLDGAGVPLTLVSALAAHTPALAARPDCSLMVGEPGPKGDPLTHPRLMIRARAEMLEGPAAAHPDLRDHWLRHQPKAAIYVGLADFRFVRLLPVSATLNGGFGKAFRLTPADLLPE